MTDIINWKAELKKIEREYDTHGATGKPGRISANGLASASLTPEELTNGAMVRIGLSMAIAVGIYFWPYARDGGSGLFWFLGAALVVVIGGVWSVLWTGRCVIFWRNARKARPSLWLIGSTPFIAGSRPKVFKTSFIPATHGWCRHITWSNCN